MNGIPWNALLWSGLAATTAAIFVLGAGSAFGWLRYRPTALLGTVLLPNPRHPSTETAGFVGILVLGILVLPPLYYLLMGATPTLLRGMWIGVAHAVLVLAMLPVYGRISPAVRSGAVPPPGRFGSEWGWPAMVTIVAGHVLYGVGLGGVMAAFTG